MAYATYFTEKSRKNVNKLLIVGPNSSFKPWENEYLEMTDESGDIQTESANLFEYAFIENKVKSIKNIFFIVCKIRNK